MSSRTRNYVNGDNPMYRSVTPYSYWSTNVDGERAMESGTRYAGPYASIGAAKRMRGTGGWVEVCNPVWEKLEE